MPACSRPLTAAETAAARLIYGDGLDYARIRLHFGSWWLPDRHTAMAPAGHIHFPARCSCADFTAQTPALRGWLMHELAHVWQYQNGFPVWLGGLKIALSGGYLKRRAYRLPPLAGVPDFGSLNMEQQAEVLSGFYLAFHCRDPQHLSQLPHYQRLLRPFFAHPFDCALLPKL